MALSLALLLVGCGNDDDAGAPALSNTPVPTATGMPTTAATVPTDAGAAEVAPVFFDGTPAGSLPELGVGLAVPGISGTALDGTPFRWTPGTRPAAIVFLAHWCPACQAEVAEMVGWLDGGNRLPEGVEFFGVSTRVNPEQGNYPPSLWLKDAGWSFPVLMDDAADTVATAFGLSGTPFWVFVDSDGMLVDRGSGRIPPGDLVRRFDQLLAGGQG